MDYSRSYMNATSMAQRIRENTSQGKKSVARGLASRDDAQTTQDYEYAKNLSAKYISNIQTMFDYQPSMSAEELAKGTNEYLAAEDAKTSVENLAAPSASTEGHVDNSFLGKLIRSESSGNPNAVYKDKKGRTFAGLVQIGEARLEDYNRATNSTLEQADLLTNDRIQREVIGWHIKDLTILAEQLAAKTGMNVTGLVAAGHLGGRTGMTNFANSGGKYNKEDELGTSMMEYYERFKD
jgi:hypothetical protein